MSGGWGRLALERLHFVLFAWRTRIFSQWLMASASLNPLYTTHKTSQRGDDPNGGCKERGRGGGRRSNWCPPNAMVHQGQQKRENNLCTHCALSPPSFRRFIWWEDHFTLINQFCFLDDVLSGPGHLPMIVRNYLLEVLLVVFIEPPFLPVLVWVVIFNRRSSSVRFTIVNPIKCFHVVAGGDIVSSRWGPADK